MKLQDFLSLIVESEQTVCIYEVICGDFDNWKTRDIVKEQTVGELLLSIPKADSDVERYHSAKNREVQYFSIVLRDTRLVLSIRIK